MTHLDLSVVTVIKFVLKVVAGVTTMAIRMRHEGLCTIVTHSHRISYHLTRGSTLTSQDYNPSSVIRAI